MREGNCRDAIPPFRRCPAAVRTLLFILFALLLSIGAAVAEAADEFRAAPSPSLCPRCPLCSRPTTPLAERLKYCHRVSSFLYSLLPRRTKWPAAVPAAAPLELPFTSDTATRAQALADLRELLTTRIKGQPQVVQPLYDVLHRKVTYPRQPTVLHFAGDNGVGKSYTARLISQALSLRCAGDRDVCDAGDNLLTIAGSGFDGMALPEARRRIVQLVMQHTANYPHGVVLIDDLTAMDPALVRMLAPLFGRAAHFPEQLSSGSADPHHHQNGGGGSSSSRNRNAAAPSLADLIVCITTDFGQQGRTVGRSSQEIESLIQTDFADLYGTLLPAFTRTFIYLPFDQQTAAAVVRGAVEELPCTMGEHLVRASAIADDAVHFLVERHRHTWEGRENGHALRRLVEDELLTQVLLFLEEYGTDQRLIARFVLDEAKMKVVLHQQGPKKRRAGLSLMVDGDAMNGAVAFPDDL